MRHFLIPLGVLAAGLGAQSPSHCDAFTNNTFRVVSTAVSANTGRNLPLSGLQPAGFGGTSGVAAGTRSWVWIPKERFQGGHDPFGTGNYINVTGFRQTIFTGPEVPAANFPTTTETYQMETGIAPAQQLGSGFRHTSNGNAADIVRLPMAALSVPTAGQAIYEVSITLTTAVPVPAGELVLFATWRGGEFMTDPNGGQSLAGDWKGGWGLVNDIYQGIATPVNNGTRSVLTIAGQYRLVIGMMTDEPVLVGTGFHGNRYDSAAYTGERMRGTTLLANDWARNTWAGTQPSLWFDFECGQRYGNGFGWGTVLFNMAPFWFPAPIPFPYGNLLMNIGDPLLFGFSTAGQTWTMDNNGHADNRGSYYSIPPFGVAGLNLWIKYQGVVANLDPVLGVSDIAFTNTTSMKLVN